MAKYAAMKDRLLAAALAGAVALVFAPVYGPARAQDAAPPPAKAKASKKAQKAGPQPGADDAAGAKDPAAASRLYTEGVKAYQGGRLPEAIQDFSNAMASGLPANLMPKALYYRGSSYIQMHEPGLAISDLNGALYIKDGLDEGERTEARKRRTAAYREAGLDEPAESGARAVAAGSADTTKEAVPKSSGFGDGFGNFFGGLFGGSSAPAQPKAADVKPQSEAAPTPAPVTTAALLNGPHKIIEPEPGADTEGPGPAPSPSPGQAQSQSEVLPWTAKSQTQTAAVEQAAGAEPTKRAPPKASPAARHTAKAPAGKGKFRIQVASVPTRDEASSVISNLQSKGEPLASAPVSVDPQKFGTNTFYRVRLGPYATSAETKAPCSALKAAGLDCLVTAQ